MGTDDVLSEGEVVDAKIIAIDGENKKVSLSIRALLETAPAVDEGEDETETETEPETEE